jgi:hypothetical protein
MIQTCYIKYGTITGIMLLCAILLNTSEDGLYAQISPIPESSSDTDGSSNNDDSSDSGSDDNDNGSSGSSDSSDSTGEQSNDMTTSEVETNPLSDVIIQNVTDELTAVGITDLGF